MSTKKIKSKKDISRRDFLSLIGVGTAGLLIPGYLRPTIAAAKAKPPVRIGYLPLTDHLILGVSYERDSEQFNNLELEPMRFASWSELVEALKAGDVHGAFISAPLGMAATLEGAPIKVTLLGHRDGSSVIVKVGSNIRTAQDLKGALIAVPHTLYMQNILLHKVVTKAGLKYGTDIKVKTMASADMPYALSAGELDGYIVAEPFGAQAEEYGVGKILILSTNIWHDHLCCILVMREDFLEEYPKAMQELTESLIRSGNFIHQNLEEASAIGGRFVGQAKRTIIRALSMPEERVNFRNLFPKKKDFNEVQDYMVDVMGIANRRVDINAWVATQYAQEALRKVG